MKAALLEEWEVNKDDEEWYYHIEKMDFKKFLKFIKIAKPFPNIWNVREVYATKKKAFMFLMIIRCTKDMQT